MERFWSLVAREECQSCTRRKPWTEARLLTALGPWKEKSTHCNIIQSEIFIHLISRGACQFKLRSFAVIGQTDQTAEIAQLTNSAAGHLHKKSQDSDS